MATQSSGLNQGDAGSGKSVPRSENGAAHSNAPTDTSEPHSACPTDRQIVETDFAELKDGTLVEVVQDPENRARTLLAVWKDGDVHYVDQLEDDGHVLVPFRRKTNEIFDRLRLPTNARSYESLQRLFGSEQEFVATQ
jgi:hypothetical protein